MGISRGHAECCAPLVVLVDAQGRSIRYLRLSLNDVCNFRCRYCSPASYAGSATWLTREEIARLVRVFVSLGVRRLRLTGGEPTLRKDLLAIVADAASLDGLDGLDDVALTTNGSRLAALAEPLARAGLGTVNVSLDTLDEAKAAALSGRSARLAEVLAGIDAAAAAPFRERKLNTVVVGGVNDGELADLVRFAWSRRAVPRFIELMPFGDGEVVSLARMHASLARAGVVLGEAAPGGWGPATYLHARDASTGAEGRVGFIAPLTGNFCDGCNRVRVGAGGGLRACLGGTDQIELGPLLRGGASDDAIAARVREALAHKAPRHGMNRSRRLLPMMGMGG